MAFIWTLVFRLIIGLGMHSPSKGPTPPSFISCPYLFVFFPLTPRSVFEGLMLWYFPPLRSSSILVPLGKWKRKSGSLLGLSFRRLVFLLRFKSTWLFPPSHNAFIEHLLGFFLFFSGINYLNVTLVSCGNADRYASSKKYLSALSGSQIAVFGICHGTNFRLQ